MTGGHLVVQTIKTRLVHFPSLRRVPVPEPAQSKKSHPTRCGQPGNQVSTEGAIGAGTVSEFATTSDGQELSAGEIGHKVNSSTTETPASNSITDVAKMVAGGTGRAKGLDTKKKLKIVTTSVIEKSMASNFGSASTRPVNIDTRILQNPLLTREDPPFELQWLLNHGEADRARLFRESMEGGWTSVNRVGTSVFLASKDAEKAMYEDGFHILTVPDDKWVGLDVPETGQRVLDLIRGVGSESDQPPTLRARST